METVTASTVSDRAVSRGTYINISRVELVGFAPLEVEYEIHGYITSGFAGSWEDPPEPGELEITEVRRTDPITGKDSRVDDKEWPFDTSEMKDIEEQLGEAASNYGDDDYDDSYDYDDSHGH